ncbi:DUF2924 domain-containing protein [Methylocystis suflitae]|uniref:DUF2924 domain-containing protein n=1 Tax=Methylocystis suflitae TaxID=2951405 RepID=UPI00210A5235|nr:DUF2924 domain-containing protein [Methylocystis suflitae]MCQ4191279.1 DUF2924 domain-containing protein [Methylocystis suflitae]
MTRSPSRRRPAGLPDATDINDELTRIAAMNIEELRERWREKRKHEPLAALTKDLMARALAHWLQEDRLGGLEAPLRRLLATVAKKGCTPSRRLKIGSVIVREYQGKAQEVLVVPGGFCWEGRVYSSLSTIALKITGTNWNGPRFFGLRGDEESARLPDAEKTIQSRALPTSSSIRPGRNTPEPTLPRPQRIGGDSRAAASPTFSRGRSA